MAPAAAAGLLLLTSACGAAPRATDHARATASSGGLTVHVTARASKPTGAGHVAAHVTVRADDSHAPGALGYVVRFGDGTAAHNLVPQFCLAGPGPHRQATWHFTHRYAHRGTYHLSVTVHANCAAAVTATHLTLQVG